jgi:hypothetical protein
MVVFGPIFGRPTNYSRRRSEHISTALINNREFVRKLPNNNIGVNGKMLLQRITDTGSP